MMDPRPQLLVLVPNRKNQRAVLQALASTGCNLERAHDLEDARLLTSARDFDAVVIDYGLPDPAQWQQQREAYNAFLHELEGASAPPVIILSNRREGAELHQLFTAASVSHLIGKRQPLELDELIVTVAKITRRDIFGLDKYLAFGVVPRIHTVRSSRERDGLLAELAQFARELGVRRRLMTVLSSVADELLTNAIYNAPVDDAGTHLYASRQRNEAVELDEDSACRFEYACDGRHIILSVRDPFGSLKPSTVIDYLARCYAMGNDQIENKEGGAGMGFFFILESLNRFVINISPGHATEMIGFIDVSGTYRDFAEQCKSFHVFCAE